MVENKAGLPKAQKLLDHIVGSPQRVLALETANAGDLLAQMRVLAMRGGTSIYAWEPQGGLASLRESGLHVPGSKRITDALRYVMQSLHFGVYLFSDFADCVKPVDTLLLRRISRMVMAGERKLVFVGRSVKLPEELEGMFDRITDTSASGAPLRLRDGRWVT